MQGSKAVVRYDLGARTVEREGYVLRQLTQVESTGRMARIVVEVRDPLGLKSDQDGLLLGAQVEVQIIGRSLGEVIELPAQHFITKMSFGSLIKVMSLRYVVEAMA